MQIITNPEGTEYVFPDRTVYKIEQLGHTINKIKQVIVDADLNYFLADYALKEVIKQLDIEKDYSPVQSF